MKLFLSTLCACLSTTLLLAQDYAGYRTSSQNGVNGVFFNPASIAGSRYRWDANVFSISTFAGNNQASFQLKNLGNSFNSDSLRNQLFGKEAGAASGMASVDIHGPSFMLSKGKWGFAVTTRIRAMANVSDVDGKLVNKITEDFQNDPQLPYTISSGKNMRVTANGWTEFGLSAARVLVDEGSHVLKAGATVKYLAGAANAYMNIDGFTGTLNSDLLRQDVYLSNSSGKIAAGFGGARLSGFDIGQLTKMTSKGVGADLGVVYEFRPGGDKTESYKLKAGVSLLDIGSIRYRKDAQRSGAYTIAISGNERLYFDELSGLELDDYKNFFNSRPALFTPAADNGQTTYSMALPATLNTEIDYHILNGFYVHLGSFLSIAGESKLANSFYKNSVALTPRYEGKLARFWLPLSYNELTKWNAGISVQVGPVFVGSGSVITALTGHSKQADFHAGVRFGKLLDTRKAAD
ncbi:MAG: hypothetical protein INR73_16915 [Williamsia sp.]|nr:hypothetical protein [Williamsia sp.]